jgi:glycosyltransferase involved in cell wall biosynthesis
MISIIYNGFDFGAFRQEVGGSNIRREFGIDENSIVIGYVSHFAPHKGQTVFLEAMARVVRKFPAVKALIVGGAVYKAYRDYDEVLENLTRELGLVENVIFTGERSDIADIMSSLDIFACVSLTEEFNRVIVEAMTFSKPVVISNVRGESVVVEDSVTGLLVPPNDPQSLASAIITLINDRQLQRRLGAAGKRHVEKTFSIERTVSDIEDLYAKVLRTA